MTKSKKIDISSNSAGPKILELFGLPFRNCRKATITIEVRQPITAEVEYIVGLPDQANTDELQTILKKYRLETND